jgi:riboflavin biosynthesis pyrimidine reductase
VPSGIVHVTAAWLDPCSGCLEVLRPGAGAATSSVDGLVLALARARADAIVTTGAVLRAEPDLVHDLASAGSGAAAIGAWRRRGLDKVSSPLSAVLTRGDGLDRSHPLLRTTDGVMVYTSVAGALGLDGRPPATSLVVGVRQPGLRELIAFLAGVASPFLPLAPRTILIEAGPSTARALYEPPLVVDELLLSILEHPVPAATASAGRLPELGELRRLLPVGSAELRVIEPGSRWRFLRMARRQTGTQPPAPQDGQGRWPRV